jgi:predicted XRE-type DNA-binding protein
MEPIYDLYQILKHIDELSDELVRHTDEISDLLAHYNLDAPVVDDLLKCLTERNQVIESLNTNHLRMHDFIAQISDTTTVTDEITTLRNNISLKLDQIIETDQINQEKISQYRDIVATNISNLLKGKRITQAYNMVPHRKAVFVDMTNQK